VSETGTECHKCPAGSEANKVKSGCEPCDPGTYVFIDRDQIAYCVSCPEGKMCPNGKVEDCPIGT